jgi:hypothetical protein
VCATFHMPNVGCHKKTLMKHFTLITLMVLLVNCTRNNNSDIERLSEYISNDNYFKINNIQVGNYLLPNRYSKEYKFYVNIHSLIDDIIDQVDSLKELSFNKFHHQSGEILKNVKAISDSIFYISRNDTSIIMFENSGKPNDTLYIWDYLDNLIKEINNKISISKKGTYRKDLDYIKLCLILLDRDIVYTLNREISYKTIDVNYIEPVIIKKNNSVDCYITSIDTESNNYIIIGQFDKKLYNGRDYYKLIKSYDTIKIDKAKAEINNDIFNKGEAILYITLSDGSKIQRKIK